jgi:hypothetical protein
MSWSGTPVEYQYGAAFHYRSLTGLLRELNYARARALKARGDTEGARLALRAAHTLANRRIRRHMDCAYQGDR